MNISGAHSSGAAIKMKQIGFEDPIASINLAKEKFSQQQQQQQKQQPLFICSWKFNAITTAAAAATRSLFSLLDVDGSKVVYSAALCVCVCVCALKDCTKLFDCPALLLYCTATVYTLWVCVFIRISSIQQQKK